MTFDDAMKANEDYERREFEKRKSMGLRWQPIRRETTDLYLSAINEIDRLESRLRKLTCCGAAIAALLLGAIIFLLLRR